ncbi:hypothetical protein DRQ36_07815 [bacterium]|nr:MAG: hypothetical protein DRQ36_07815 [bacterium]
MKTFLLLILICSAIVSADVILDPGHGGSDPGATGPSYTEKEANLDVAFQAKTYLESAGVFVGMTRDTDIYVSLADRCNIANTGGYERFMSIHENAFDATVQGTETYCYGSGSANSFDLRNKVHPELIWAHSYIDRGTKTASYYVLVHTTMPAILGEGTFIDYTAGWDESWRYATNWNDHEGRQGYAYAKGYCIHRDITPPDYDSGTSDTIIIDNLDPEFSSGGVWNTGTYPGGWGADYFWCDADTPDNWARWTPDLPRSGEYDVFMWWLAGANRCDSVFVRVFGLNNDSMLVSQKGSGGDWHFLGRFDFDIGTAGYVSLGDRTAANGDVVIADAVMWIYVDALGIDKYLPRPEKLTIEAYPNPFNSSVTILLERNESFSDIVGGVGATGRSQGQVGLKIFDINGRLVADLPFSRTESPGEFRLVGNRGRDSVRQPTPLIWRPDESLGSGVYLIKVNTTNESATKRVIYLK